MCLFFSKQSDILAEINRVFSSSTKICFTTATSPNLTSSLLEVPLGTKNEIKDPLGFSFKAILTSNKYQLLSQRLFKSSSYQRTPKENIKRQMQLLAEICQNRTAGNDRLFQKSSVAHIEKCRTNKSQITTWGKCTKSFRSMQHSG